MRKAIAYQLKSVAAFAALFLPIAQSFYVPPSVTPHPLPYNPTLHIHELLPEPSDTSTAISTTTPKPGSPRSSLFPALSSFPYDIADAPTACLTTHTGASTPFPQEETMSEVFAGNPFSDMDIAGLSGDAADLTDFIGDNNIDLCELGTTIHASARMAAGILNTTIPTTTNYTANYNPSIYPQCAAYNASSIPYSKPVNISDESTIQIETACWDHVDNVIFGSLLTQIYLDILTGDLTNETDHPFYVRSFGDLSFNYSVAGDTLPTLSDWTAFNAIVNYFNLLRFAGYSYTGEAKIYRDPHLPKQPDSEIAVVRICYYGLPCARPSSWGY